MKYSLCALAAALLLAAPVAADDVQLSDDAPWGQYVPTHSCPILQLIDIDRFTSKAELDYKDDNEDHGMATWDGKALNIAIDGRPDMTVRVTDHYTGPTTYDDLMIERHWTENGKPQSETCEFISYAD